MENSDKEYIKEKVLDVFKRRIKEAPSEVLMRATGYKYLVPRFWDFGSYAILSAVSINDAKIVDKLQSRYGHPYPYFICTKEQAFLEYKPGSFNSMISGFKVNIIDCVCKIHSDSSFIMRGMGIVINRSDIKTKYNLDLTYCICFGKMQPRYTMPDVFERLIVRSLREFIPEDDGRE